MNPPSPKLERDVVLHSGVILTACLRVSTPLVWGAQAWRCPAASSFCVGMAKHEQLGYTLSKLQARCGGGLEADTSLMVSVS